MGSLPVGKLPHDLLHAMLQDLPHDPDVLVGPGIGRDAAAVRVGEQVLIFKTDPITFPTDDAGWYLVNINANDIACMGAAPKWLLVTALLPENDTTPELVSTLFSSIRDATAGLGCTLIGGHTEITEGLDRPILVGQMIGVTDEQRLVDPTRARPGDAVLMIGGIAVEGTAILATDAEDTLRETLDPDMLDRARTFARDPGISVVSYAQRLTGNRDVDVRAMHDPTEGGLGTGLREIADATGYGIQIDQSSVFIHAETSAITSELGIHPWGLIASGALLAVVDQQSVQPALESFSESGIPAHQIGSLTDNPSERTLIVNGKRERIPEFAVDEIARYFADQ